VRLWQQQAAGKQRLKQQRRTAKSAWNLQCLSGARARPFKQFAAPTAELQQGSTTLLRLATLPV